MKRSCLVEACENPHRAKGFCQIHYCRFKRYGDPNINKANEVKTHCKNGHEFSLDNTWVDKKGWRFCKTCLKSRRTPYKDLPEKTKQAHIKVARKWGEDNRAWKNLCEVLRRYKLTLDEYHTLLENQDFHCAICDEKEGLCVDHNHKTNKVRGLLCFNHNVAIGHFYENVGHMKDAVSYLEKH